MPVQNFFNMQIFYTKYFETKYSQITVFALHLQEYNPWMEIIETPSKHHHVFVLYEVAKKKN